MDPKLKQMLDNLVELKHKGRWDLVEDLILVICDYLEENGSSFKAHMGQAAGGWKGKCLYEYVRWFGGPARELYKGLESKNRLKIIVGILLRDTKHPDFDPHLSWI